VEEIPWFSSMKTLLSLYTVAIYSDHRSLSVGDRERGMGLAVPKKGNVMTGGF
jgi:hypothetical protein